MGASQSTHSPQGTKTSQSSAPQIDAAAAAGCPVDHKTREVWLRQNQGNAAPLHPKPNLPPSVSLSPPPAVSTSPTSAECSSSSIDSSQPKASANSSSTLPPGTTKAYRRLSLDREVSSIPRAFPDSSEPSSTQTLLSTDTPYSTPSPSVASHGLPSNSEGETGHDGASGNWIYPSERMFFEAMSRKSHSPQATDMRTIVPIHNAVNERAWSQILAWERTAPSSDPGSKSCGGPKLYSFRGLGASSEFMSPKARWNTFLGYQAPFDRHDWVVQRCDGERIEYVIDFYEGRNSGQAAPGKINFYLDARPKLSSWDGVKMRACRFLGLT